MSSPRKRLGPVNTLSARSYERARRVAVDRTIAVGFSYSRKLEAHKSCVNALVFSRNDGRWLASAGDDLSIHMWDFNQENVQNPSHTLRGPQANVLTMDFSATNQFLYSGGTDNTILKHDIYQAPFSQPGRNSSFSILGEYRQHEGSIRGISCHPFQEEIFLSASEDGMVIMHDSRVDRRLSRAQGMLQHTAEFTSVKSHPTMDHIFATSDAHGQVCLRDTRMAFGPLKSRSNHGVVQIYNTELCKRSKDILAHPESSSIVFDHDGTKLATNMLHYFPTIYSLSDPNPLAVCNGKNHPDGGAVCPTPGERTYSNSCTMKSGAFGNQCLQDEPLYATGSDDFRGYVWKLPPLIDLSANRKVISADEWFAGEWLNTVAFTEGQWQPKYVPVELSTPLCRLNGHNSIVTTVAIHPTMLHIVTAGIERNIILHSPTPNSPCTQNLSLTSPVMRTLRDPKREDYDRVLRALMRGYSTLPGDNGGSSTDDETISLFDHILRQEGEGDVFALRSWNDSESEDAESDGSGGDDRMMTAG
ncbi:WD40 repeat-like protein [Hygrophoropsis aurantiaca]|uniref:WD40 repeat-like protein n=1 Tax=Hygrophoropsis aurantiaca TaxID=72124 RepID=A0ACB8AS48_9AGAM|nr:WD40 repeat-like protein [Hygrophoropsis aurantiaca]